MKNRAFLLVSVLCAALRGLYAGPSAVLSPDGHVELPEFGLSLGASVHLEGWKGTATPFAPGMRFPDAKTGTAKWDLRSDGKSRGSGRTVLKAAEDGAASFRLEIVSGIDQTVEAAVLSANLPAMQFAGATWSAVTAKGAKSGTFPVAHDPKRVALFADAVTALTLTMPGSGKALTFSFARPTRVHLQDSRRWGDNFSLRVGSGSRTFAKGTKRVIEGRLSAAEPFAVSCRRPVVIDRGPDWIALDYKKDIVPGSALDFSSQGLQDAPAGKHGWLKNVNGHFEFEKLPGRTQRFYGVNLCFTANYPTHEMSDALITRLVRLGYNTIRVHHYERDLMAGGSGMAMDPVKWDRIDYLLAKAIGKGFYITTDIFVSRPVAWRDIGLADRGNGVIKNKNLYKCLVALWDPAFEDWCRFAEIFLKHVNPYTGRAYADEPALPLISLVNEGQLSMGWSRKEEPAREDPIVRAAWKKWLTGKRAVDPSFCPDAPEDCATVSVYGDKNAAVALFMAETERKSAARMTAFLRKLGTRALLTNANCGPHFTPMQFTREDCYDYVDDHFYVDHPQFIEKPWSLPSRCGNENPVLAHRLPPTRVAFTRMADKPFTITEWNFSGPGMFRGVGGIMTGAYSALQDWDGLWRFAYSHSSADLEEGNGFPGYFNTGTDPLGQASDRASICLFLRRDLAPLADAESYLVTADALHVTGGRAQSVSPSWAKASWFRQVSTCTRPETVRQGTVVRTLSETHAATNAPFACTANPAFAMDEATGSFTINTPRTAGGFTPAGSLACGPVAFAVHGTAATVWASSVDAEPTPIAQARRLVVTHLTDVQAAGNRYAEETRKTLLAWGRNGTVVRAGSADVALALEAPDAYAVWALETSGRRLERIPCAVRDGRLCFTASVDGPNGARMIYEVVREK